MALLLISIFLRNLEERVGTSISSSISEDKNFASCALYTLYRYNINEDYAVNFKNAHGNLENRIKTEAALGVSFAGRSLRPCDRGLGPRKFMFFVNFIKFIKCVVLYAPYT